MTKKTSGKNSEEVKLSIKSVISGVEKLVAKGNQRQLVFTDKSGKKTLSISLTVAVILTAFFPVLVVISALISWLGGYEISIKKTI